MPYRIKNKTLPKVVLIKSVDWRSIKDLIAHSTLWYLAITKWPTVRRLCTQSAHVMEFPWQWFKAQDLDDLLNYPWPDNHARRRNVFYRPTLCGFCGWLTRNMEYEYTLSSQEDSDLRCDECDWSGGCLECTYSISAFQRCCALCSPRAETPARIRRMQEFLEFYDLNDRLDHMELRGDSHPTNTWKAFMLQIFKKWRLECVRSSYLC